MRDDAARARLRDLVGDIGLVLYAWLFARVNIAVTDIYPRRTLYESKGLEFDDVT